MTLNKSNPEVLKELTEKEQEFLNIMRKNIFIIKKYELENDIERGKENDQHKGK